jgi:NAD+ synthase (glutamine-hydrolysing)
MHTLRLAMAQINPIVGDLKGNSKKIVMFTEKAKRMDCDIVIFPELAITGYPPEDLLLKPQFVDDNIKFLKDIAKKTTGITSIIGFVDKREDIFNAAAVVHNRRIAAVYHKMFLPNYGVFDEERYFLAGSTPINIVLNGITIGIGICEDIWYPEGPARAQALAGAQIIININASPYHMGKAHLREEILATRATDNGVIVAYNNIVGGQDELVFDGHGMVLNEKGEVIARGKAFKEDLIVTDLDTEAVFRTMVRDPRKRKKRTLFEGKIKKVTLHGRPRRKKRRPLTTRITGLLKPLEEIHSALVLGTRDYVKKNGFRQAIIGLSGGIDSALVASIAVDALGSKNVIGAFMPSRYTSNSSREDAISLARNLNLKLITLPIDEAIDIYLKLLKATFKGCKRDVTEENIQARIRGNILMAISNKFGWLVLTTGNKSETSVGYATLYGDMAGGFAVIKDIPKTKVYELSRYRNSIKDGTIIPERILKKEPSAELKPNQKDQDTLPPYDTLDPILKAYIEEDKGIKEMLEMGFNRKMLRDVIRMVDTSEYKRRQTPPGIKITPRAFGKDRRMPITNRYM